MASNDVKMVQALQQVANQDTVTIENIQELIESFGAQAVLASNNLPRNQTLMMHLCDTDQMTVPMMQLLIDEAKTIGEENNNEFVKQQLDYSRSSDFVKFVPAACGASSSLPVIQLIFSTCIELFEKEWLLDQLQASLNEQSLSGQIKALAYICSNARSVEVVRFVFKTFLEIGSKETLFKELEHTNWRDNHHLLIMTCIRQTSSVEMVQVVLDQYAAADATELLRKHFTEKLNQRNARFSKHFVSIVGMSSCSDEVFSFVAASIGKVSGDAVLEEQLFVAIWSECGDGIIIPLERILNRLLRCSGPDAVKRHFQNMHTSLVYQIARNDIAVETLQFVISFVKDKFGTDFVLTNVLGRTLPGKQAENLLSVVVHDSSSTTECLDLVLRETLEIGGSDALKALLAANPNAQNKTALHYLCSFCEEEKEPVQKLKLLINKIINVGGKDFLREQLEATDDNGYTPLHLACTSCGNLDRGADETVNLLFDASLFAAGTDEFLQGIFDKKIDRKNFNLVTRMFLVKSQRFATIEIILSKIIDIGGKKLLKQYLRFVDSNRKPHLCSVSAEIHSESAAKIFVALLVEFDLFTEQYAALNEGEKQQLAKVASINNDEWLPSEYEKNIVSKILQGDAIIDAENELGEKKANFEQEMSASLKHFEENAAKKKPGDDEEEAAPSNNNINNPPKNVPLTKRSSLYENLEELIKQPTITAEDVQQLVKFWGIESVMYPSACLANKTHHHKTLLMYCCDTDQVTVPMMQLFIDEAKKIGEEEDNNEFLRKQMEFALSWGSDPRYDEVTFICMACARSSSLPVIQLIFATCIEEFGKKWLLQQLRLGFGTSERKTTALRWICLYARSVDVVRFVFSTFLDIGDKAALKKDLDKPDSDSGSTVLISSFSGEASTVEMAQLVMDQYVAVGGDEFLKKHLTLETQVKREKKLVLTLVGNSPSPNSILDFFMTSIDKVCGVQALKSSLKPSNGPLAHICATCGENTDRAKLIISKILSVCGPANLKQQFQNDDFISHVLERNQSFKMLQFLLDTAKENFGPEFVKECFLGGDRVGKLFDRVVRNSSSAASLDLVIRTIHELCGFNDMKKLLTKDQGYRYNALHSVSSFARHDKEPEKKLSLLIYQILNVGGKELLKEQLGAPSLNGETSFYLACKNSREPDQGANEFINTMIDAIVYVDGGNNDDGFLKTRFFDQVNSKTQINFVTNLFCDNPRLETIEIILANIVDVGGKALLRNYLRHLDKQGKNPLSIVNEKLYPVNCDFGRLFAALLVELDLFKEQFEMLSDSEKGTLKTKAEINSIHWLPTEDELILEGVTMMKSVRKVLCGASSSADPNECERRKKFKEKADIIYKRFVEDGPKRKAEQEDDAKKKAEEEAAAKKQSKEAAAAKKKADKEAVAKKKAEEELAAAVASAKKADEEADAGFLDSGVLFAEEAAAQSTANEEAAVMKKTDKEAAAEEEVAAAAKKKAEEETAVQKNCLAEDAIAKKKAEEEKTTCDTKVVPDRTSSNEPAVATPHEPASSSSSTIPYEKMQEGPEEKQKPVKQGCPCVIQ